VIRLDPSKRKDAIEAGFLACSEDLQAYKEAYYRVVEEWNPVAVCDDDKTIGCLISKDGVIHLAITKEYRGRWASRRIIKEMLGYGTSTSIGTDENQRFVERIGFKKVGPMYEYQGA
jgi:GNAT superfamily N-acetyltransferase